MVGSLMMAVTEMTMEIVIGVTRAGVRPIRPNGKLRHLHHREPAHFDSPGPGLPPAALAAGLPLPEVVRTVKCGLEAGGR
jgi:hypothetical protein